MNDGPRAELAQHVDAIESAYEFMLAYAAQGREGDDDAGNSSGIRRSLTELASALEDLVAVCKALVGDDLAHYQAFLDVVDFGSGHYTLEVTSPGLDRVLKDGREFEIFRGRRVHIWMEGDPPEREGVSLGLAGGEVQLRLADGELLTVPWPGIKKARLVPEARSVGGNG